MTALKIADLQRDTREEGISLGMELGAYETKLETAKNYRNSNNHCGQRQNH